MRGLKGNDIWNEVKEAIIQYVNVLEDSEKVTIYTFAEGLSRPTFFDLKDSNSKTRIKEFVLSLKADGKTTCTYRALAGVIDRLTDGSKDIIFLYTDGLNNCSGQTMPEIARQFKAKRDDYDYLYYISLGQEPSQEVIDASGNDPNITAISQSPKTPPVPKTILAKRSNLRFDFSEHQKEATTSLEFGLTGDLGESILLDCKLVGIDVPQIKLVSRRVQIIEGTAKFTLAVDEGSVFNKDINGVLELTLRQPNALLGPEQLDLTVVTPKKRKSRIIIKE
ncbi:MAG: VWA domain-containing protein [Roseivirga sp.]|nr:VWA domain-containing protein [Roseivirga sp.]